MTRKALLFGVITISVLLFSGYLAQAQKASPGTQTPGPDPRVEQMADRVLKDLDTNHDGKITKSEWEAFYSKQFDNIDKSRKGYITKDDIVADLERMRQEQPQRGGPAPAPPKGGK